MKGLKRVLEGGIRTVLTDWEWTAEGGLNRSGIKPFLLGFDAESALKTDCVNAQSEWTAKGLEEILTGLLSIWVVPQKQILLAESD